MKKPSLGILLSYLVIYVVWGSTYLFIKMGVETMPPFYLVGGRFFLGGLFFMVLALATGKLKTMPSWKELLSALFLGIFLLLLGNGFVSLGERTVDSYLAALIVSSTPFAVGFFNGLFFREKLPLFRLAGMVCGVAGVGLILYNGKSLGASLTSGVWMVIGGLVCWALATSLGHRMKVHPNNLVSSGLQMVLAGALGLAIAAVMYGPPAAAMSGVSVRSWIGLAYLTVLGALGFYCYSYLIRNEPSIRVVSYAIINPLIAVVLGIVIEGEKPAPFLALGLPLVLAGLVLMLYGGRIVRALKRSRKAQVF